MAAYELLATNLNRNDDEPNQQLAVEIIRTKRTDWVEELVGHLNDKNKSIQSDCIKVLYEIGERGAPELIALYAPELVSLLESKNNRLVWGAMTALDMITPVNPKAVFENLPAIIKTIDQGSVITIDHGVGVLAGLAGFDEYTQTAFPLLMEQLRRSPFKQLPMYAGKSVATIKSSNKKEFIELLESRLFEMEKDSQKKRIEKMISKLGKGFA